MDRQLLLLGLLRREEMHGYQINEFIEEEMHFCIDLKKPTAYYILDKMAQEGYVAVEREQAGNRPPRRIYRVTSSGQALYFQLLRENLANYSPTYYATDIGIAFMDQLPPGEVADHLQQKRDKMMAELEALKNASGHTGPLRHVLDRNQRLLKAELEWLDELIEEMMGS